MTVDEHITISAPPNAVWPALIDAEARKKWWSYLELDPVIGGRFAERWTGPDGVDVVTSGAITELAPERLLRLTWSDADWPASTYVEITLEAVDAGTLVRVRHTGWDRLPDGARLADEHRSGWRTHLDNLRHHVEGG